MSEFTFLFRGPQTPTSPEQMQKTMEAWFAWFKELGAKGHIKSPGNPLEPTGAVVSGTAKVVNDGPFAEAKDIVGGFTIIEAESLQQAIELAGGCPILADDGSVEIRPVRQMNM